MPLLCAYCSLEVFGPAGWQKLWAAERNESYLNLEYERPYADLIASAELQCRFCGLIIKSCREDSNLEELLATSSGLSCTVEIYHQSQENLTPGTIGFFTVHGNVYAGKAKDRNLMDFGKNSDEIYFDFDVGVTTTPDNAAAAKFLAPIPIKGKYINFDPEIAVKWLRECSNNHSQCHYDPQSMLPKRVLDCDGQSSSSQICLVETTDDQCAEYAALSYVWGGPQPFLTLSSNVAEHTINIDMASLPNTLRDAVHVTRALGLRYLWIDALCIVQDSIADKVSEIGRMNQYYRDAFCVIAASKSKAVTDGFLTTRTASNLPPHRPLADDITQQADRTFAVPFTSPDGEPGSLLLEANPTTYSPGHNPLNTRCWAFQERLLCPRILQFPTPTGFTLQCNSTERFAGPIAYRPEAIKGCERMMQPIDAYGSVKRSNLTPADIHDSWLSIVCEYTDMAVSVPGDRLIAIAALAEEYHTRHPGLGRYLAGHWGGHLHYSLHWTVFIPRHELRSYRAPSWSWASVEGATYDAHGTIEGYAARDMQILECITSPAEETLPFGAVASGHLKIRARLEKVVWRRRNEYTARILQIVNGNGNEDERQQQQQQQIAEAYPDTIENMPQSDPETDETVFLMDLHTSDDPSGDSRRLVSLVLRECGQDTFRRVGKAFAYALRDEFPVRGEEEEVFYIV